MITSRKQAIALKICFVKLCKKCVPNWFVEMACNIVTQSCYHHSSLKIFFKNPVTKLMLLYYWNIFCIEFHSLVITFQYSISFFWNLIKIWFSCHHSQLFYCWMESLCIIDLLICWIYSMKSRKFTIPKSQRNWLIII